MGRDRIYPASVFICTDDGAPVGAGLLVGPSQVLTCAHVVLSALDLPLAEAGAVPHAPVHVRFTHLEPPESRQATAHPERWFPPGAGGEADPGSGDIALLTLHGEVPAAARPVSDFQAGADVGQVVYAFGLPPGHDEKSGGWASGVLAGQQASGWIQIDSPSEGFRIQPGFSGAAAWSDDHDAPVGMIVAAELSPDTRVAWMIPASLVSERCPEVAVSASEASTGPRIVLVTNSPGPPDADVMNDEQGMGEWFAQWLKGWFDDARVVVNIGGDHGITRGDYFDVLAKRDPVENEQGEVLGFVDESGCLIRAVDVQPKFSVCQVENFGYARFYEFVVPRRLAALGLAADAEMSLEIFTELNAIVAVGDVVKPIPPMERFARDEIEELYGRAIDEAVPQDERQGVYREMVRRADQFLLQFPSGYFADGVLSYKGWALFQAGDYQASLDTFRLYRRQYPFGSTEGAEKYIHDAEEALAGRAPEPGD